MIATRRPALGSVLTLALVASLGLSAGTALGQATKVEVKTKPAKEQARPAREPAKPSAPVDLNSATADELKKLPGVGEATARKIIDGRPHKSVDDLAGAGVNASEIAKLRPLVEVKPLPSPVDVNVDPLDKIRTLPGIGPVLAAEIVAGRPLAGYEALAKLKGIGPEKLDALRGRVAFGEGTAKAKAKAKVAGAEAEEAAAHATVAETKAKSEPRAKAKLDETKARGKVAEAKIEEKVKAKLAPGTKVNINTAEKDILDELPGIGPIKAQAILDARATKKFEKIEDVMTVKGIKEGEFAKIKDIITVK